MSFTSWLKHVAVLAMARLHDPLRPPGSSAGVPKGWKDAFERVVIDYAIINTRTLYGTTRLLHQPYELSISGSLRLPTSLIRSVAFISFLLWFPFFFCIQFSNCQEKHLFIRRIE